MIRTAVTALFLLLLSVAGSGAGEPRYELLFVDKAGCPWCVRFERETMVSYMASDIGRDIPLRRASLDDGQPRAVTLSEPVRFTPTFIILKDGAEVGRLIGYRDNATFFGLLEQRRGALAIGQQGKQLSKEEGRL
jgi:hypothetical protein